jgi:hypothetical protein
VVLPGATARVDAVDQTTAFKPPATTQVADGKLMLPGFGVAVVTLQ